MPPPTRVYALQTKDLAPEQLATTFAMASRRPEPFDQTAKAVSATRARDFHERWTIGYGHASVAEHAVLHIAVENVSRLAADALLDCRLASYTEKSSRYQRLDADSYHTPEELTPDLAELYRRTCRQLFIVYHRLAERLAQVRQRPDYDSARAILPAATLTNLGMTVNARSLAHLIGKLRSHPLSEVRQLGDSIYAAAAGVAPTLVRHAEAHPRHAAPEPRPPRYISEDETPAELIGASPDDADRVVCAALLFRRSGDAADAVRQANIAPKDEIRRLLAEALRHHDAHDPAPREFELVNYRFRLRMDYGALREYRRHRMQTVISAGLTTERGFRLPNAIRAADANIRQECLAAARAAQATAKRIVAHCPEAADYLTTHGHRQEIMVHLNLRELMQIAHLRTTPQAHPAVAEPVREMCRIARSLHPELTATLPDSE